MAALRSTDGSVAEACISPQTTNGKMHVCSNDDDPNYTSGASNDIANGSSSVTSSAQRISSSLSVSEDSSDHCSSQVSFLEANAVAVKNHLRPPLCPPPVPARIIDRNTSINDSANKENIIEQPSPRRPGILKPPAFLNKDFVQDNDARPDSSKRKNDNDEKDGAPIPKRRSSSNLDREVSS